MKKIVVLIFCVLAAFSALANRAAFIADDDARQALYGALDSAYESLKSAPFGKAPIAVLPLKAGHSILAGRLKNVLVKSGFVCVEGKEDPMWDEILKEIEWDERKDDILDPETVVRFGKLKAAKIIFQCDVRVLDKNSDRIYAEIELRATDIATKQIIWGGSFAYRHYIGKNIQGIITLDTDLRMLLRKSFAEAQKSITTPQIAGKLDKIKTVIVVPVSGDLDSYITNQATAMLTQTHMMPQNPHVSSLVQIRSAARDGFVKSDAIFYGSLRALHKTKPTVTQVGKDMVTTQEVFAEMQFFIEDAKNGNILWGDTLSLREPVSSSRAMTAEELKQYRKERFDGISEDIKEDVADNWKYYVKVIAIVLGAVILLGLVFLAVKAFFSFNNVR